MSRPTETDLAGARRRFRELAAVALEKCTPEALEWLSSMAATMLYRDLAGQSSYLEWLSRDKSEEHAQRERRQRFTVLPGGGAQ